MAETYNVFLSWSGPRSKSAAEALKQWLPLVVQAAKPWMSATDIDKGTRWREEVTTALDNMKAGVICLTPENLKAEWLLFEAGALSKTRDPKTRVWTYLLAGLKTQDFSEPLAMFQATTADKEDTRKLVHSINKNLEANVPENGLNQLFDKMWPDLGNALATIPPPSGAAPPKRSLEEMVAETLELMRSLPSFIRDIATRTEISQRQTFADMGFRNPFARPPDANFFGDLTPRPLTKLEILSSILAGKPTTNPPDSPHAPASASASLPASESQATATQHASPSRKDKEEPK